jgi:very-short-patch-repair endonuclease
VDAEIAALAERQHGVVARAQLLQIGVGSRAIGHRLACGRLHPVHRGVYAVGHRLLTREGRWTAAVLAAGAGAVLSHRSAAALWGIRRGAGRIEVTTPRALRARPGLRVHQARLAEDEVTVVRGIPATTPARTLLDLAAVVGARQLERAVNEAEVLRLGDAVVLADLLRRHRRRRGAGALRRILDEGRAGARVTRSELEDRFTAFLDDAGLPRPETNVHLAVGRRLVEADCVWRGARLVVELDGFAGHAPRQAFERDRARDRALLAAGWRVARVTWRQLTAEPRALAAELRALLSE